MSWDINSKALYELLLLGISRLETFADCDVFVGAARAGAGAPGPWGEDYRGRALPHDLRAPGGEGSAALPASRAHGASDCAEALPFDRGLCRPQGHPPYALHPCLLPSGAMLFATSPSLVTCFSEQKSSGFMLMLDASLCKVLNCISLFLRAVSQDSAHRLQAYHRSLLLHD